MMDTSIVLIGGSAGSIRVLLQVLPAVDADISFPIVVVLHRKAYPKSALDYLFNVHTTIPVLEIEDKMELKNGIIYLVPADYHILFEDKRNVSLDASEKVNYSRPSIDIAFQSAARVFHEGVTAILLSGGNRDGIEGLITIAHHDGIVFIQDPLTAEVDYMPRQALEAMPYIQELRPEQMAGYINNLK